MVKVSGGGREAGAVQAHFAYMGKRGKLEIETDDGRVLTGKGAARELVEDWNLDLSAGPYRAGRALEHHKPVKGPKDAHNIVLSMPKGTDAKKLFAAAKAFAENQFAGKHRYAMVLHTHQGNPHVHLVVKAKSEQGQRIYIRKAHAAGLARGLRQGTTCSRNRCERDQEGHPGPDEERQEDAHSACGHAPRVDVHGEAGPRNRERDSRRETQSRALKDVGRALP